MKTITTFFLWIFTFIGGNSYSQVIIASEDFENSLTLFTATGPSVFYSGLSGAFYSPLSSPFAFSNTYAYGVSNRTDTLTSSAINTSAHATVQLTLKLASFATNLSGGNDLTDNVRIEISPDDGLNYYSTVQVTGNMNGYWSYTGGTGNASTAYDGNPAFVTFSPAGGGNRTTDGYSTITITSLPESVKLRVRIILINNSTSELWVIDKFEITGSPVVGPLVTIYPLALTNFIAVTGNFSPEKAYEITGSSLTNDISINAPTGYDISTTSGSGFGSSINLSQSGGIVSNTTIYVRLNTVTIGSHSGNITNSSTGATTKNVAVNGNVLVVEPTVASSVSFANITPTSMDINFSGGNGAGRIVVMKKGSAVSSTPADATDYTANNVFGSGTAIAPGEFVVYIGSGSTVNVTGLDFNRTYHVAVFEYNDGGLAAARNYYAIPGTGNANTLPVNEGLELTASNTIFKIDFDNTVARVNNGAFAGVDIVPFPATGQLNSNAWSISGTNFSGTSVFGGSTSTGGGVSTGNVSTDTYYAFETSPGNRAFGIQPSNTYWGNGGNITLRLQNNTGEIITTLAVSFKLLVLNNTDGAMYSTFEYSTDNLSYFSPDADTTTEIADVSPTWKVYLVSQLLTGLTIPNGDNIYFRWNGLNYNFLIEPDEIAWDDISIVANPTTVFPRVAGNHEEMFIAGPVQLSASASVVGNLTLDGQNIELGDNNLTIGGIVSRIGAGYLRTNGTGTVTINNITTARFIPLGVTTYNPLTISNGNGLNWTVRLNNGISNVQPPNNTDRSVLRTWTITPSTNPPPSGANLVFGYNDGDPTQLGINFNNTEDVQVWHYNGTDWIAASGGITPTGTPGAARTVTLSNWSQFSSFAIANLSGPLPVAFGLVKAKQITGGIKISWENLTEKNISFYTIERSTDGRRFNAIGQMSPSLNNGDKAQYEWLDGIPFSAENFYRIAATELDGKIIYSMIVKVKPAGSIPAVSVYPNPVKGSLSYLQLSNIPKGRYELTILTISGQQVHKNTLSHDGGSVSMPLKVPGVFKPGLYIMQLKSENIRLQTHFIYQ